MLWPTAESTQPSLFLVKVSPFQGNNFTTMCTQHYSKQVNKGGRGLVKNYEWVLLVLLPVYFIKWLIPLEAIMILRAFTIEPIFMGAITTVVIHWYVHLWAYFVFKHRYVGLVTTYFHQHLQTTLYLLDTSFFLIFTVLLWVLKL